MHAKILKAHQTYARRHNEMHDFSSGWFCRPEYGSQLHLQCSRICALFVWWDDNTRTEAMRTICRHASPHVSAVVFVKYRTATCRRRRRFRRHRVRHWCWHCYGRFVYSTWTKQLLRRAIVRYFTSHTLATVTPLRCSAHVTWHHHLVHL